MAGAETRGDQDLDGLPEEFVALIAEETLGLDVDHLDQAGAADHDDRVRGRFHDLAQAFLAPAQALGDVRHGYGRSGFTRPCIRSPLPVGTGSRKQLPQLAPDRINSYLR